MRKFRIEIKKKKEHGYGYKIKNKLIWTANTIMINATKLSITKL